MQHSPLQYMASSLSHTTICLNPSNLPPSVQFASVQANHTSLVHFHKALLTYMCLMASAQYAAPIIAERRCEMRRKVRQMRFYVSTCRWVLPGFIRVCWGSDFGFSSCAAPTY